MVILTIGDFDEAVVASVRILICCDGRCLAVIIEGKICISQSFILLFGDLLIVGIIVFPAFFGCLLGPSGSVVYVALIVTKGNGACFVSRGLVADSCSILNGDRRSIACCQRIIRIRGATGNSNGERSVNMRAIAADGYRRFAGDIIQRAAKDGRCFAVGFIPAATCQGCMDTIRIIIETARYRGLFAKRIIVVAA